MNYEPLLETMMVERSLDKIDQVELEKLVVKFREENSNLKKQLGYKNQSVKSYNIDELIDENVKLKRELGYTEKEIENSLKKFNPYKKSNKIWIAYMLISLIPLIAAIIFIILVLW